MLRAVQLALPSHQPITHILQEGMRQRVGKHVINPLSIANHAESRPATKSA